MLLAPQPEMTKQLASVKASRWTDKLVERKLPMASPTGKGKLLAKGS
jgi:hypothetical protein